MITTKDVLRSHDEIHTIWELGMHENAMSKNEIIKANIQQIANNIISKREGFVFRLSGVLLCGIARLYSKKTHFFLIDCEEAIARISLRFEPIEKKKKKNRKENNLDNIEIDEDTIKLWQGERNLESIIELEQRDESNSVPSEIILSSSETNTSPNINTQMIIDNDFGNVPFEISACSFDDSINIQHDHDDNSFDILPIPYDIDNDIDNSDLKENSNEDKDENINKSIKKNWYIIDPSPIIPLTQLSVILEDTSKIICQRPINKARICAIQSIKNFDRDGFLSDVQKIIDKIPVFNGGNLYNDDTIVELPPLESDDMNANDYFGDFNANDKDQNHIDANNYEGETDQELDQNQKLYSVDLISDLKHALERKNEEDLINIVPDHSRRSLALSFFTALSLKNRGIVEIKQSSEESISLSKGPNFYFQQSQMK